MTVVVLAPTVNAPPLTAIAPAARVLVPTVSVPKETVSVPVVVSVPLSV